MRLAEQMLPFRTKRLNKPDGSFKANAVFYAILNCKIKYIFSFLVNTKYLFTNINLFYHSEHFSYREIFLTMSYFDRETERHFFL